MPESKMPDLHPFSSLSRLQRSQQTARPMLRRRPTPEQGRALETLGHAVEYLIDEGLLCGETIDVGVTEALHLLSSASRALYLSCAESAPAQDQQEKDAHIRWRWIPSAPFMLPMFRTPSAPAAHIARKRYI